MAEYGRQDSTIFEFAEGNVRGKADKELFVTLI
jgi:hypothetical protein